MAANMADVSKRMDNIAKALEKAGYEVILNKIIRYRNQLSKKLKSKEITYARISRCLTHILLDIKKKEIIMLNFLNPLL